MDPDNTQKQGAARQRETRVQKAQGRETVAEGKGRANDNELVDAIAGE